MENENHLISVRIAMLLVGFFANTLLPDEHAELDGWITASDANQKAFEDCLEITYRPYQPTPDDEEDEESEELREIMYTAEIIMKYFKNTMTVGESTYLQEWSDASPENRKLLDSFPKTDDMEVLCNHMRSHWFRIQYNKMVN